MATSQGGSSPGGVLPGSKDRAEAADIGCHASSGRQEGRSAGSSAAEPHMLHRVRLGAIHWLRGWGSAPASLADEGGVDFIFGHTIFGVHSGYIRPRKQRTCGYIRVHSGTFGTLYVQEAVVADVAGPNFCFMWGGTFGATSLSFYNTKREEELCPEAAPRPVGSRILPANDRSHTSPC